MNGLSYRNTAPGSHKRLLYWTECDRRSSFWTSAFRGTWSNRNK